MCELERTLQNLENNTYFRIGKIREVGENQEANRKSLVSFPYWQDFLNPNRKKNK